MNAALALPDLPPLKRGARVWLAYSGGLDSSVLLHALAARGTPRLTALHVHHGLQAAADGWARRCRAQCRALGVPFRLLRVQAQARDGEGPEAAAREARYAALRAPMKPGDVLITAHHRDDQAETVLLRLLRGTGIAGLAAMRPLAEFAPGHLWRPLLNVPREQLQAYAQQHALQWIEDPHNADPRYARSWLRSEVMPVLARHWPQAGESLARAARHAAQAQELLDELAEQDAKSLADGAALGVAGLLALSAARRANLLRHWVQRRGFETPAAAVLERLEREVLRARADAQPLLHAGDCEFRRYRDHLCVMTPLPPAPQDAQRWDGCGTLALAPGCGTLHSNAQRRRRLSVCYATGGERLKPAGGAHTRTLKQLFQQAGVPPWERQRTPLLYRGDELLSVAGRWSTAEWTAELAARGEVIQWVPADGIAASPD